ncbi:MAG: YcxB family protein [Ruminococcaceae bacterium]|nr:YcxB family protein [Oscillospiraceae bacterium]
MEVLFENSYVRNKQLAKEIYCYYYFQRKWLVVCYVLVSISFIVNLLGAIFKYSYNLTSLVYAPLLFLFMFYCYFRRVNASVKQDNELYGKEVSFTTIVTDEYIQNTASTGAVNKFEYNDIKSAAQTKNLILLRSKTNLIYIFRKDTFTKGSKEEFIMFLREKGIKIK